MKQVGVLVAMAILLAFVSCEKGEKAEQASKPQESPKILPQKAADIAHELGQRVEKGIDTVKEKASETVEAVQEKSQEVAQAVCGISLSQTPPSNKSHSSPGIPPILQDSCFIVDSSWIELS